MSESTLIWVEISFDLIYLTVVWALVERMYSRRNELALKNRRLAGLFMGAFALLALGDSGHVGFRVLGYAMGDLESTVNVFGRQLGLVGMGAMATAYTVTLFYVLALEAWRERFQKKYGWFEFLLLGAAILRLFLMMLPANQWNNTAPPQPWGTIRNLPLILQGLGLAYLILRDARSKNDRTFWWIGISILVSYACYLPVILFVQDVPILGMLMMPKTMAYVVIGFLAYGDLYRSPASAPVEAVIKT